MRFVRILTSILGALLFVTCTATITAQLIGVGVLCSRGILVPEKMVRFAGVLYGLDPFDLSPGKSGPGQMAGKELSREEAIADRVQKAPQIADRQTAIRKGTDDIRAVVLGLKFKRERQNEIHQGFESYLEQQERDNTASALREIQITLESLPPKLAKDIVYKMLSDAKNEPNDDVLNDVVTITKAMPAEKLRKIFAEFKTTEERDLLHQIFVKIGNLDDRKPQLTGNQP